MFLNYEMSENKPISGLCLFYIPWYNKSVSKLTIDVVDYLHLFFYNKR